MPLSQNFGVANTYFKALRENKILAKISEFWRSARSGHLQLTDVNSTLFQGCVPAGPLNWEESL